jgi:hypothetical protein
VWQNHSKFAEGTAFNFEHTIKTFHGGPHQEELYAAHGFAEGDVNAFGTPMTAKQVQTKLAEVNVDFPFHHVITDQVLAGLEADGVALSVLHGYPGTPGLDQSLGTDVATWLEFLKLPPMRELLKLTNPEAKDQVRKIRKGTRRPADKDAVARYVKDTISLERIEIPK